MSELQNVSDSASLVPVAQTELGNPGGAMVVNQFDPSKGRVGFWCSLPATSARDKAAIFNAMNGKVQPLDEKMNEQIVIENVLLQGVSITNVATGEISECVRCVLFDKEGKTYGCVSTGVHESVKKIIQLFGLPPFSPPLIVMPRKQKAKTGSFYTLELIGEYREPPTEQPQKQPEPPKTEAKKTK